MACSPGQIFVRAHSVSSYTRSDGTYVSAYSRAESCRNLDENYEFRDSINPIPKGVKTKIGPWSKQEKALIEKLLAQLPGWLGRYKLQDILRGNIAKSNEENPATVLPGLKSIVLYDEFFKRKNQKEILIHELAHIAVMECDLDDLESFYIASGWVTTNDKRSIPPAKVLLPDSKDSKSEDFANHVEVYYSNPNRLKAFNPKSYRILQKIIDTEEKEK